MKIRASGTGQLHEIDRWTGGAGWIAHPEEAMQRASHVLESDGEAWVIDPVDADGLDEWLDEFGHVAGVVVPLARHKRDAAAIARRHDVSVHVPEWMTGIVNELDAPVERINGPLADTDYRVHRLIDTIGWQEGVLYNAEDGTLLVPEALGTAAYDLTGDERVGVHPMLRLMPPKQLREFRVERLLLGHGEGVFDDPEQAIADAIDGSRRRAPALYAKTLRDFLTG